MNYNTLPSCSTRGGVARIVRPGASRPTYKLIPFRCGKMSCPVCRNIKRKRLVRRLKAAHWPSMIYFWTITTDPGVLSADEALRTLARRWHLVCRNLQREYPDICFFRVLEFTQSGLPHMHVMFNRFVSWHTFQRILMQQSFGRVLHVKQMPRDPALAYLTKYITKSLCSYQKARELHVRSWSASLRFIPHVSWFQDGTEFQIVYDDHLGFRLERMLHYYQLYGLEEVLTEP